MEKIINFSYKNIDTLSASLAKEIIREIIDTRFYLITTESESDCFIDSRIYDEVENLIRYALSQKVIFVTADLNPFRNTKKGYLLYFMIRVAYDSCHVKLITTPYISVKRYKRLILDKKINKDKDSIVSILRESKYRRYKGTKFYYFLASNFSNYRIPPRNSSEGWVYSEIEKYFVYKNFLIVYSDYYALICNFEHYSLITLDFPLQRVDSQENIINEINFHLKRNFCVTLESDNVLEHLYRLKLLSSF